MDLILTHDNADFDAAAALLGAFKLYPDSLPVLPDRLNRNVERFITLYQSGLPFVRQREVKAGHTSRLIVVDTQRPLQLKGLRSSLPVHIIDHHPLSRELGENHTFVSEPVGAVTTLLVEQIRHQHLKMSTLEATLLALGIYEDTGSLTYGTTDPRDLQAAAWLLHHGADLDTIRRFLSPPLSDEQQILLDQLLQVAETRIIEGYSVVVSAAEVDRYISEISSVAHRLRDMLDPAALFILVQMPESLQMVARSTDDSVDVGALARLLGGGGHSRAAAASIHDRELSEVVNAIWGELSRHISPLTRVVDLMSYGVQTVDADQAVEKVVRRLRRIGHEGYPVVQAGRVVGLLTRRDLDRAVEHGLGKLPVQQVMTAGTVTASPGESVFALEQRIVETGWGQIPVVDDSGRVLGIVTRTDLIKHWARVHPPVTIQEKVLTFEHLESVLGSAVAALVVRLAEQAQHMSLKLYMVGGVVRDLLLHRFNLDIDFVVEGNAIELAQHIQVALGGRVSSFEPFGTAKWRPDDQTASHLGLRPNELPDHIDFATARNEFYEHPTALPTVYSSSVKLDLQRRDFTINTLAVQLSPASLFGRVLDFYGGLADLDQHLIRVLHSLSFVDDPTRILRAVRFERRLGFAIEERTSELIASALPMLGRITGERLRNELALLLAEEQPELGLINLQKRGVLRAIHEGFVLDDGQLERAFEHSRKAQWPWDRGHIRARDMYWHIMSLLVPTEHLEGLLQRLLFSRSMSQSMTGAAQLRETADELASMSPGKIVALLTGVPEVALLAVWLLLDNEDARYRIRRFWLEWRHIQPVTNGYRLREMGIKAGPCYGIVLGRLRAAWLDGEVTNEADEEALLSTLLRSEETCRDSA